MGVSDKVQKKVIEVTTSSKLDQSIKLQMKKEFYNLKYQEVELGEKENDFQQKVNMFEKKLDELKQLISKQKVEIIPDQEEEITGDEVMDNPTVSVQPNESDSEAFEVTETN